MKIGVAVHNLGPCQIAHGLISSANALVGSRADADVVAFYETLARPCLPMNFAAMQMCDGYGFDGPIVATTLSTAEKLVRFPSCPKKVFFVWDLEWLRSGGRSFRQLLAVYSNPELTLLARSADHARAVADCWGTTPAVLGDEFDIGAIAEWLGA